MKTFLIKPLLLITGLVVAGQAFADIATSFDGATLITTTGQTLGGYTVTLDATVANLTTDSAQPFSNSTLVNWANDGNTFHIDRVRFNPSGNTATWNITGTAAPGAKLYFAVIDVDNGSDQVVLTDGTKGLSPSLLVGGYDHNGYRTYKITTYTEDSGTLTAITSANSEATAVWDVSNLSKVTWTPNSESQQAAFFTVAPRGVSHAHAKDSDRPLAEWVDPFIATQGDHGQLYPGAVAPFGLVKLSPDTSGRGQSGYQYQERYIFGFSHLRVDGPGCAGSGADILLQPGMGTLKTKREELKTPYIKSSEKAHAGYYTVTYENGIKTQLTATQRVGIHQYTFPNSKDSHVNLDLSHSLAGVIDAELTIQPPNKISGMVKSHSVCWHQGGEQHHKLYFAIEFDKPFKSHTSWKGTERSNQQLSQSGQGIGAGLSFGEIVGGELNVKVGLSPISAEQAQVEIETEAPGWNFDETVKAAEDRWEKILGNVAIQTERKDLKTLFYTLLYRSYTMPQVADASSGMYRPALSEGTLKNTKEVREDFTYYCGWDIWGNYRNKFGLIALTHPNVMRDSALAIVEYYRFRRDITRGEKYSFRAEGYWPAPTVRQEFAGIYILEALYKGIVKLTDEEMNIAFEGMRQDFVAYPDDNVGAAVEKAYHAWLVMKMAEWMGRVEDVEKYKAHALEYTKHWSAGHKDHKGTPRGFFTYQGKPVPDVLSFKYAYEGHSWHYKWPIPYDVQGMINLRGSREALAEDLELFFDENLYMALNQTDIHLPYLFNYLGKPWLTQKWVRAYTTKETIHRVHNHGFFKNPVVRPAYQPTPDGFLPTMDDDLGQNSSWFVQSAIGLFPAIPGERYYFIGSPIFPETHIELEGGKKISIIANNVSEDNFYIRSAKLNGKELNRCWIDHAEIAGGGVLELEMGATPNKEWGSSEFIPSLSDL